MPKLTSTTAVAEAQRVETRQAGRALWTTSRSSLSQTELVALCSRPCRCAPSELSRKQPDRGPAAVLQGCFLSEEPRHRTKIVSVSRTRRGSAGVLARGDGLSSLNSHASTEAHECARYRSAERARTDGSSVAIRDPRRSNEGPMCVYIARNSLRLSTSHGTKFGCG